MYYVPASSRADFGVNKSQYTCMPLYFTPYLYGANPMCNQKRISLLPPLRNELLSVLGIMVSGVVQLAD